MGESKPTARVWWNGEYVQRPVCCEVLARVFQPGTDNEGYGAMARTWNHSPTSIYFGSSSPSIRFCPWCGTEMKSLSWSLQS